MKHEAMQELVPAYAFGATDAEERAQVEAHLEGCADCRALADGYMRLSDEMLHTVPMVTAPAHLSADLRRRIASSTPATPFWRTWFSPRHRLVLGFAAALLLLLLATNLYWSSHTARVERDLAIHIAAIESLAGAPAARLVSDDADSAARGILYFHPDETVAVLRVSDMPALPDDETYQLWLIRAEERDSGGLFRPDDEGTAVLLIVAPRLMGEYDAVGVTVEPAGGSPTPTSPRVIGSELEGA